MSLFQTMELHWGEISIAVTIQGGDPKSGVFGPVRKSGFASARVGSGSAKVSRGSGGTKTSKGSSNG